MNWWQFGKWFGKWISQWTDRSVNKAVNESVNELVNKSVNESVKYLGNESVNKFVNKSANESVNVTHFTLIDTQNLGTPDRPPHTHKYSKGNWKQVFFKPISDYMRKTNSSWGPVKLLSMEAKGLKTVNHFPGKSSCLFQLFAPFCNKHCTFSKQICTASSIICVLISPVAKAMYFMKRDGFNTHLFPITESHNEAKGKLMEQ